MRDLAADVLRAEGAFFVGGAVRDELFGLGEPRDVDVVVRDPRSAARRFARRSGGSAFPISAEHGAWRVVHEDGRTLDLTPLHGTIDEDLARRDFTIDAMAIPLADGDIVDPFDGRRDVESRTLRHVSTGIFDDDPLRLLRAVRLADTLSLTIAPETERLIRERAELVTQAAGERVLAELERLSIDAFGKLDELGLLAPLGGSPDRLRAGMSNAVRLVAVFWDALERYPISNEQRRFGRVLRAAQPPVDDSPRAIHRFRRTTEPWALEAAELLAAPELSDLIREARAKEPPEPLVRGDELGLPAGPEIGAVLAEIEEERAAGTISTKEEALEFARRRAGAVRRDG
jgi:tRNA nucleotidyltransferase/poly(A) polymerase